MGLRLKLWLILGTVMTVLAGLLAALDYRQVSRRAEVQMLQEARDLRAALMATRRVYHRQFLDSGLPLNDQTLGFLPAHALLRISQEFGHWTRSGVRFNNMSDRPRNPENQADAPALDAMAWFRRHPGDQEYTTTLRQGPEEIAFHYASPIWTEPYCLECHASPEDAPPTIRQRYSQGYGYQPGELRGVLSIRIPLAEGMAPALAQWRNEQVQRAGLLLMMLVLTGLLLSRFVSRPIRDLSRAVERVATGGAPLPLPTGSRDELGTLARSFNAMAQAVGQRERALADSQAKYRILADYSQGWEYWLGADGRYVYVSPACRGVCGHGPEDFLADPGLMERLLHPDDQEAWRSHLDPAPAAGDQGHHAALLLRIRRPDGEERWIEHACAPIFDEGGSYLGRRGANRDVTEARRHQSHLAALAAVVEHSRDLVVVKDRDLRVVAANPAFAQATGHATVEGLIGKTDAQIFGLPVDQEPVRGAMQEDRRAQSLPPGQVLAREEPVVLAGGVSRYFLTHRYPIHDADGTLLGTGQMAMDITDRKRGEELERYGAFQAGIAEMSTSVLHNIGNAITAVGQDADAIGHATTELARLADLLERSADGGDSDATLQHQILREAARALRGITGDELGRRSHRLVDNVRHISDIIRIQQTAALPSGHRSSFSLTQALEAALELLDVGLARRGIQVKVTVDPAVEIVTLSHNHLLQALVNVLRNGIEALDARPVTGVAGLLEIRAEAPRPGWLRLSVRDNGIGFPAHVSPRLFTFGFSTKQRGSGFGLHSVAVFAQESGGQVSLTSPGPGQGALLVLELPCDGYGRGNQ